jgi:hypothetical protein
VIAPQCLQPEAWGERDHRSATTHQTR